MFRRRAGARKSQRCLAFQGHACSGKGAVREPRERSDGRRFSGMVSRSEARTGRGGVGPRSAQPRRGLARKFPNAARRPQPKATMAAVFSTKPKPFTPQRPQSPERREWHWFALRPPNLCGAHCLGDWSGRKHKSSRTGTIRIDISTLFSLEEPQSVRKIAMLSRAAGISGLMSKPPGGFVSARMNSRQRQRHRCTERQADAKTNPSVKNAG